MFLTIRQIIGIFTLLVLDILWLSLFMGNRYQIMIPKIQKEKMILNYYSAIGAYLLMIYLLINVVYKYDMNLLESFLFGFSLYGVYDLTCGSIFNNWNFKLALIDMIWGGCVYMISSFVMSDTKLITR
jgi:uncharacterized membrane protein